MRAKIRFLAAALVATAMLVGFGTEAQAIDPQAGSGGSRITRAEALARNTKATAVRKKVQNALEAGKSSSFKDANGKNHVIAVVKNEIVLDGKTVVNPLSIDGARAAGISPASVRSTVCTFKIAAALAAILALGGVAIAVFVGPLAASTPVLLAGLTFQAGTWLEIAAALTSAGILVDLLHNIMC